MQNLRREPATLTILAVLLPLAAACGNSAPHTQPATTAATTRPPVTASPATTRPAGVYGDLRLGFVPATSAATAPVPPIAVSLVVRAVPGGAETTWTTADAPDVQGFQFQLTGLPPGRYSLQALRLRSASLDPKTITVPTAGPGFTVPGSGCAYIGLIYVVYYRLPPGTLNQQDAVAARLANGKTAYYVYLKTGGLLGDTAGVGSLPAGKRPAGSGSCAVRPAKF